MWRPDNTWNFTGDWRVMRYPQSTYGLGMYSTTSGVSSAGGVVSMDYKYLRFYQTCVSARGPGLVPGPGLPARRPLGHYEPQQPARGRLHFALQLRRVGAVYLVGAGYDPAAR